MATTRKNRQTGTQITIGSAVELGLNDGQGWLTICEDHGWITSHPTRKLAERHASDPMGWCEVCNGQMSEDGIPASRTMPSVLYIDTMEADAAVLRRNERRPEGDHGRCLLCAAPIGRPERAQEVHLCKGGIAITLLDAPYDDPGDMGIFLIGPECYRKHKAALAPYVGKAKGKVQP